MKKLVGITGVILIACLMITSFYSPTTLAQDISVIETLPSEHFEDVYIIKSLDNRIAVYKKGESEPFMITDSKTDSLPKGDIVYLEKGIEVTGESELKKALEDYCS